jgi:hypothetical protein
MGIGQNFLQARCGLCKGTPLTLVYKNRYKPTQHCRWPFHEVKLKERGHWEDLDVDWRIILKWKLKVIASENVDWLHLALDGENWQASVNAVINLRVP